MEELYKALSTYYETIFQSGYMSIKKVQELLVFDFIMDIMLDPDYMLMSTTKDRHIINDLYRCVVTNNCLI